MQIRAVYPGAFDPITNGHLDIACRASAMFAEVIIAVYDAPLKKLMFSTDERIRLFEEAVADAGLRNVSVRPYTGLTVQYARQIGAQVMVRGIRAFEDFVYEADMALMNRRMEPDVEVVFLMTRLEYSIISSSRVKEIGALGAEIDDFVPRSAAVALKSRLLERHST